MCRDLTGLEHRQDLKT